jgi:hypothetical protein
MAAEEKAHYYGLLRDAGVNFDKHYRDYKTDELKQAWEKLSAGLEAPPGPQPEPEQEVDPEAAAFYGFTPPEPELEPEPVGEILDEPAPPPQRAPVDVRPADPMEMAGQRLNSQPEDEPIRIDPDTGRAWFQEEILKPGYPKPRGRRVLTYMETGTKQIRTKAGDYVETFEVAGDEQARVAEVKVTLPSYQVGIFRDPRFPFKVHCYNGLEGFDLFEVHDYYGGPELVPPECKRIYVENVLCWDIRSVVRAIETEYRQLVLSRKVEE